MMDGAHADEVAAHLERRAMAAVDEAVTASTAQRKRLHCASRSSRLRLSGYADVSRATTEPWPNRFLHACHFSSSRCRMYWRTERLHSSSTIASPPAP
jgi:hypothetical protein